MPTLKILKLVEMETKKLQETINSIVSLVQTRNQWSDYMESFLDLVFGSSHVNGPPESLWHASLPKNEQV